MFSKARVGDEIFSMRDGVVRIVEIDNSPTTYPIRVEYGYCLTPGTRWITVDGKQHADDAMATYYWSKPEVTPPSKPLPDLAIDTPILVRNHGDGSWYRRHFAGFIENGMVKAWPDGMTSFSTKEAGNTSSVVWEEWMLPKD